MPRTRDSSWPTAPRWTHATRQVRNAIGYVLNNWRRHGEDKVAWAGGVRPQIDPYASGVLFDGWNRPSPFIPPENFVPLGTTRPQTWLLEHGWRRHPLIDPREVPGPLA